MSLMYKLIVPFLHHFVNDSSNGQGTLSTSMDVENVVSVTNFIQDKTKVKAPKLPNLKRALLIGGIISFVLALLSLLMSSPYRSLTLSVLQDRQSWFTLSLVCVLLIVIYSYNIYR